MTELTRRQLREQERNGGSTTTSFAEEVSTPVFEAPREVVSADYQAPTLTRRQLREQGGRSATAPEPTYGEAEPVPVPVTVPTELDPDSAPEAIAEPDFGAAKDSPLDAALTHEGRVTPRPSPLPPIGLRRELRQPANDIEHEEPSAISSLDAEIPEQGFRGANYLGEPSTQSIMLEVAPEAISLPLDTGEVFSTGSISILSEPTGSVTGSLDGIDLDSEEAVTGIISIVEPVSARDLIDERSPLGVVPSGVLLKGWWRPWAVGAFSLAMAIAAILASITIFNALGA